VIGRAVLVRQVVWSSFGKLSPEGSNLVPVERILGIIVLTGSVAAPGGSSSLS
jgi:hypothetical protein